MFYIHKNNKSSVNKIQRYAIFIDYLYNLLAAAIIKRQTAVKIFYRYSKISLKIMRKESNLFIPSSVRKIGRQIYKKIFTRIIDLLD